MGCHQADAAEQAARRSTGGRPACPERHLLGAAVRSALAGPAGHFWSVHHLQQSLRSLAAGVWGKIMHVLAGAHDAAVQMIDTSIVRVHQHGACIGRNRTQSMGRSRGGLTSKIHAVVDTNGLPLRLALTAGEAHDNRLAGKLLSRLKAGTMPLADRGYDADWIRALAAKRRAWANIPPRSNRNEPICFSPYLYRARNLVERFFNKIKQCRRVATRYDKLAVNYLAFIQLASIRLWLRVNESTP
jgi:transposase